MWRSPWCCMEVRMALDLKHFATSVHPLHPSGLRMLMLCPWRACMSFLYDTADEGGAAGDTGSATHAAVAAMHTGSSIAASLEAMRAGSSRYPRADLQDAAGLFLAYATDPRNRDADVVAVERQFSFSIEPAREDPTQERIQVVGTFDQVRRVDGHLQLWDVKTSKKDGATLLANHSLQAAAYCIGASVLLGEQVHPGGLVLPRRYPRNAHWPFAWKWEAIPDILQGVRHVVARIRAGDVWHTPSDDCTWCGWRTPDVCLPKLVELRSSYRGTARTA
jgi:hypothetical protein